MTRRIKIFEKNQGAREALERVLVENQLDDCCEVVDSEEENSDIVIKKPVRIGALLDRIRRHLAALKNTDLTVFTVGPYEADVLNNLLTEAQTGHSIRLTDKEMQILVFLSQQAGTFVERRALLDAVWGYAETVETHTLETHIYRLRQKIEKDPSVPEILMTVEQGYLLQV